MHAIIIENVSRSQLSIARFSGGARINGVDYVYIPHLDILIQKKHFKEYAKLGYKKFKQFIQNGKEEIKTDKVRKSGNRKTDPQVLPGLFDGENMSPF